MKIKLLIIVLAISIQLIHGQSKSEKIEELLSMLHNQEQFNGSVLIAEKGKVIAEGVKIK